MRRVGQDLNPRGVHDGVVGLAEDDLAGELGSLSGSISHRVGLLPLKLLHMVGVVQSDAEHSPHGELGQRGKHRETGALGQVVVHGTV